MIAAFTAGVVLGIILGILIVGAIIRSAEID